MARKPVIIEATLKSLGLKRLAELVHEACERDDVFEKKVRLLLAATGGSDVLDTEIGKRIKGLIASRTFYDWETANDLVRTIDLIRARIVNIR